MIIEGEINSKDYLEEEVIRFINNLGIGVMQKDNFIRFDTRASKNSLIPLLIEIIKFNHIKINKLVNLGIYFLDIHNFEDNDPRFKKALDILIKKVGNEVNFTKIKSPDGFNQNKWRISINNNSKDFRGLVNRIINIGIGLGLIPEHLIL